MQELSAHTKFCTCSEVCETEAYVYECGKFVMLSKM